MRTVVTVGVYRSTPEAFLRTLHSNGVGLVFDVRQRRGVRGTEYAWANSLRLQAMLTSAGVAYVHRKELAPTTELRHLQYREDAREGAGKRSRIKLADEYRKRYDREILERADLAAVVEMMPEDSVSALLCVEQGARACHRSLIAERLRIEYSATIIHL